MTREEKCQMAIEKGFTYNPETGQIFGIRGEKYNRKCSGYVKINLTYKSKSYYLLGHQFAWYWVNKECVECLDHINGLRDDNRISNLRAVTFAQNYFNLTKAKGYTWNNLYNKWQSRIQISGKSISLGYFDKEDDARIAYLEAKTKYHDIENINESLKNFNNYKVKEPKGYSFDKSRNKWYSTITINKKRINLGRFDKEEDARQAYVAAKEKYHVN
jgi:hypothetical protein